MQIIKVVRHILLEKGWWQLPRYAFGSSSGGCIALELALRFPLQVRSVMHSLACMCQLGTSSSLNDKIDAQRAGTLYVNAKQCPKSKLFTWLLSWH